MVTRGNVAIYCYNALTAKTWDVTESTDGSLTSSSKGETILVKYFSDFVNDANQMKLVEDATVVLSGANTTAIGANQIKLYAPGIASFIDAEDEPRKGEEEVTYNPEEDYTVTVEVDGEDETVVYTDRYVVAYVPENVADISVLQGKTVDVIFGKDNEVAYVQVTNDAIDRSYVTAWDNGEDKEIELNGEAYEVLDTAKVYVLGYEVDNASAHAAIDAIMTAFEIGNAKKTIERDILADVILTAKDEVESINFIGSLTKTIDVLVNEADAKLVITEDVVKKVASNGTITTYNKVVTGKLEDLDEDKITVIKNGEVIKAEEIEAGNVLTVLKVGATEEAAKLVKIYVSDTTVTGTLDKVKNEIVTVDGEEYSAVKSIFGNTDGDFNKLTKPADLVEDYLDEEVEVYLNFMGEIAVVVSETESVPATIGIVTKVYEAEEDGDKDDVEYVAVKILSAETGKATKYYIYNEDDEKDFGDAEAATLGLAEGVAVWFSADANNIIEYATTDSDIRVVAVGGEPYEVDGKDLVAANLSGNALEEKMEIGDYIFDDGVTTYYNTHVHAVACAEDCEIGHDTCIEADDACAEDCAGDIEVIAGWSSLVVKDTTADTDNKNADLTGAIVLHDDEEVVFFIADIDRYATTVEEYAIVESIETRKENNKTKTFVTLVGDATEYELKGELVYTVGEDDDAVEIVIEEGDFVTYELSDDKITLTEVLDAWTLASTDADESLKVDHRDAAEKAHFEVDFVDGRRVRFVEFDTIGEDDEPTTDRIDPLYLVKDTVTVYDLDNGTIEKVDVEDLEEVIAGRYAAGYKTDSDDNYDVIVLF